MFLTYKYKTFLSLRINCLFFIFEKTAEAGAGRGGRQIGISVSATRHKLQNNCYYLSLPVIAYNFRSKGEEIIWGSDRSEQTPH